MVFFAMSTEKRNNILYFHVPQKLKLKLIKGHCSYTLKNISHLPQKFLRIVF
jgi:hypothetical protein